MPKPVGEIVTGVVQKECPSQVCPFRSGDGDKLRARLKTKSAQALDDRVSDGDKVRELEKKVKLLETVVSKVVISLRTGRKFTPQDLEYFQEALKSKPRKG